MALSRFETSPVEILEEIVLCLVTSSFLGPPTEIIPLLLLGKHILTKISLSENAPLYARIFAVKFDVRAPRRRLSDMTNHLNFSTELVKRMQALKRLKNDNYAHQRDTGFLRLDLWTAYTIFIECDGKNSRQLIEYAKVDRFALNFVSFGGLLHHGARLNGGWTVDSEENALALWLFWFTDKHRVPNETLAERLKILQALGPLFVGSFKYESTHAPITSFQIPPTTLPPTHASPQVVSLAAPTVLPTYLISDSLTLSRPLLLPPALLSSVVRYEAFISEASSQSNPNTPATREEAIARGYHGPTEEDFAKAREPTTKFAEWGNSALNPASDQYEQDWMRLRSCYDPLGHRTVKHSVFVPGMLDGVWVGRYFSTPINFFKEILRSEQSGQSTEPHDSPIVYPISMQFRLREHHQHNPDDVVGFEDMSSDGTGKGVLNAWFPKNTIPSQVDRNLQIYVPGRKAYVYKTYDAAASAQATLDNELPRDSTSPYDQGIWDIILTAETDESFALAWGPKRYYGRVRAWDGLVVLVREKIEEDGKWIFSGYFHGMQNLVGRWRETGTAIDMPAWEGVWSMTKVSEE